MNKSYSNLNIPIPIETALFSEDGEIDPEKPWRWWFKFPDIWTTSNLGEKIVGIRQIYLMKNRRNIRYTLKLKKYRYTKTDDAEMIDNDSVNELVVEIISWLPTESDLREIYDNMVRALKVAIEDNEKTKTDKQVSFVMSSSNTGKVDIQMDGVFQKYQDRYSFVEQIYCPNNYQQETIEGIPYYTKCMFKIEDENEDFHLIFNTKQNPLPDEYITEMNFYDVWDRHSCKIFSNISSDTKRLYIGNSQVEYANVKYFKINSTDKKFYIDFYNSRNINCPSVIPFYYNKNNNIKLGEPFVIEMQLMLNEKLLYI